MAERDLTKMSERKAVIEEIQSDENTRRKDEHQKRFDVYQDRATRYIEQKMRDEMKLKTIQQMRKLYSIIPCKKIISEMASLYDMEPERTYDNASDNELQQIENMQDLGRVDARMRVANAYFKLHKQIALLVLPNPATGLIERKPMGPHMYDVIPNSENPEVGDVFLMNVWDRRIRRTSVEPVGRYQRSYQQNATIDESIADDDDYRSKLNVYKVWDKNVHFTMNGKGEIVSDGGRPMEHTLGRLPIVDISIDKDFTYFVKNGSNVAEFSIDWALALTDQSNIFRMQGFSQPIIASDKLPENVEIGPNNVLFLELDPARENFQPRFEFVSPSPDIGGGLEWLEFMLKAFMSSEGVDTSTITGRGDSRQFTSGMDRLLHMLDMFTASKQDMDIFRRAEKEAFDLERAWSNEFQSVTEPFQLDPKLQVATLSDDIEMEIKFAEPSFETEKEKTDRINMWVDEEYMSKVEAIMEIRGVTEDRALEIIQEIEDNKMDRINRMGVVPIPPPMAQPAVDDGAENDDGNNIQNDDGVNESDDGAEN